MPSIASGASASITVPKGYLLAIAGGGAQQGVAVCGVGPLRGVSAPIGAQAQAFGPYPDDQVLQITAASGALAYSLQRADGLVPAMVPGSPFRLASLILEQNNVAGAPLTGTVAETVLASIAVPGGLIGPNGSLRVRALQSCTNSAGAKTLSIRMGGQFLVASFAVSTTAGALNAAVCNRNSHAVQINFQATANAGITSTTSAVDTSVDQMLTITGTLASGADTMKLESYLVEVVPG